MTETQSKPNFKSTLNLPKTPFPMRANLAQNEPQSQKRWAKEDLYSRIAEARRDSKAFVFHDGPPYANGSIHAGHLLNKVLKDFVVRSKHIAGTACRYVPGWDCHGLPIEHKVMSELVESGKIEKLNSLDEDKRRMAIRRECKKSAEKYIKIQKAQMQRLLTLAEYDDPYLTMNPRYEMRVLDVFADLLERGMVYRAVKAVHWSIANETALAEAELEYHEKTDPSVYVTFEAEDPAAVLGAFGAPGDEPVTFMVWTTTPWTLPANVGVAVHPRFDYALVRVDGSLTVIASELVERVTGLAGASEIEVVATTNGQSLLGLRYKHPIVEHVPACGLGRPCDPNKVWSVVAADYVTMEDGTGLVHTAPGHGAEDYLTGVREHLPVYCPVQKDGTYDHTAPQWLQGKVVWDANEPIVNRLKEDGRLFHALDIVHSYPHDWRSKTPVIFRATEQWFISVDQCRDGEQPLRQRALEAIDPASEDSVRFIPEWGRNRLRGMLDSRPDWCISRQRAWGLPIPAFETRDGAVIMTPDVVRAVAERFGEAGSDAWFTEPPEQLLATWDPSGDHNLPESMRNALDKAALKKTYDIFDVWFESGTSWNAVLRERDLGYPSDLYLEGSDQHRGWFQSSLLPSLGATGRPAFTTVLTHGFVVDKDGYKMSKSGGNALDVDEVLKNFGADVCRWWVSSLAYENDVKGDLTFFEIAGESYRKVRNTLRFLLSNLNDFEPCSKANPEGMCVSLDSINPASIDGWVLGETSKLAREVTDAYASYEFRRAHQALYDFCNETLSAIYCAAVKDRLYCDAPDSVRRRTTQTVMWDIAEVLSVLLAPIMPHTADEAYRALHAGGANATVHLQTVPHVAFEADAAWASVLDARDHVLKALEEAKAAGLENPLDAGIAIGAADGTLTKFLPDLADLFGVSRVELTDGEGVSVQDLRDEPRCERSWKRDGTVRQRSNGSMLSDRDAEAVGV